MWMKVKEKKSWVETEELLRLILLPSPDSYLSFYYGKIINDVHFYVKI